jgi:hypothetical protein
VQPQVGYKFPGTQTKSRKDNLLPNKSHHCIMKWLFLHLISYVQAILHFPNSFSHGHFDKNWPHPRKLWVLSLHMNFYNNSYVLLCVVCVFLFFFYFASPDYLYFSDYTRRSICWAAKSEISSVCLPGVRYTIIDSLLYLYFKPIMWNQVIEIIFLVSYQD